MENKTDDDKGEYHFKPITVQSKGIPIPTTPATQVLADDAAIRHELFKLTASQIASEIDSLFNPNTDGRKSD